MFPLRDTIPSRRAPVVLWLLILANGLVFLYELQLSEAGLQRVIEHYALIPAELELAPRALLAAPQSLLPLVTSMFLHGGWLHVIGNLWMLAIFGDNVEDRMGKLRFLVFYLACGVLAGAAHEYFNRSSE